MKNFKIRAACGLLVLTMGVTGITGCKAAKLDGTKTVVTVNDEAVSLGVASMAVRHAQAQNEYYYKQFAAMYGTESTDIWDTKEDGSKVTYGEKTKNDVLEKIEKMCLVRAHAADYQVELTDEEKTNITEAAKSFIEANDGDVLSRIGVTQADVEEYLELNTYYEKAFEPMLADVTIEVTDEEAKQSSITYTFLSTNELDDEAKAEVKSKMETLLEEYKAQEDIASFDMKAYTEEKDDDYMTSTASFGDEDDEGTVDDAVKEAAKELQDGQLYDGLVEGSAGYFIVRMDKVMDPEATQTKKESLTETKRQEAFDAIVDGWLEEANIKVEKSIWKKVTLTDKESYSMKIEDTAEDTTDATTDAAEDTTDDTTDAVVTDEAGADGEQQDSDEADTKSDAAATDSADTAAAGESTETPAETQEAAE